MGRNKDDHLWAVIRKKLFRSSSQSNAGNTMFVLHTNNQSFSHDEADFMGIEDLAAITIQTCFRGHLATQALKALKSLVKLQAVVRSRSVSKKTGTNGSRLHARSHSPSHHCSSPPATTYSLTIN
ncbi:iq-domain [Castilleja foliolosa]|uniref:Iq-domain n=1 Tax=Castilleja foliolosa TaxID=1961234 RepID=A0ABD3DUC0_9LAMI